MDMRLHDRLDANPWLGPLAAFALGAATVWLAAAAVDSWRHQQPARVSDKVLRRRVRARLGDLVARPDAVQVAIEGGVVRLSGVVLPQERDALLAALIAIPGVRRVRNALGTLRQTA